MEATELTMAHALEMIDTSHAELLQARARIAELETALGGGFIAPQCFGLTRTEERLVGLMMQLPRVSREQAATALYDDAHRAMVQTTLTIQCFIQKVRVKLKAHGIIVNNIYGAGWAIPAQDKERILAMIEADSVNQHFKQKAAE